MAKSTTTTDQIWSDFLSPSRASGDQFLAYLVADDTIWQEIEDCSAKSGQVRQQKVLWAVEDRLPIVATRHGAKLHDKQSNDIGERDRACWKMHSGQVDGAAARKGDPADRARQMEVGKSYRAHAFRMPMKCDNLSFVAIEHVVVVGGNLRRNIATWPDFDINLEIDEQQEPLTRPQCNERRAINRPKGDPVSIARRGDTRGEERSIRHTCDDRPQPVEQGDERLPNRPGAQRESARQDSQYGGGRGYPRSRRTRRLPSD